MEELLKKSRSFSRLHFYNNELIDPYTLAFHGFKEDQKNFNEAKCSSCRSIIKFDPLEEIFELKDDLEYSLKDHEEDCEFNDKNCTKRTKLTKETFLHEGPKIYKSLLESYEI